MTPCLTIDEAIADPALLGAALDGDLASWATWRAVLKAAFGIVLSRSEARAFGKVAGGRKVPRRRIAELWAIVGRRGGKSRMAAVIATYLAAFVDHSERLAPGETGYVLVLAVSKSQAQTVFRYVEAFFETSPILAPMVESVTASEIRLNGGITIAVHPNSYRTVRSKTLLAAVFDEAAFWRSDESVNPDLETYRAVLPSLATTGGMLVGISSPYRRLGLLYAKHRDYFGVSDPDVLVIQAPTIELNPTIDRSVITRARKDDPEAAKAEWDAEFRQDISALLDDAVIDAAIDHDRPIELPPRAEHSYVAFTDASAGRHDAFTIGIGHYEGEKFVADVIRGTKPPFDPKGVAKEYAELAKSYRCSKITGDNYAGEWVAGAFRDAGLSYNRADQTKSTLYLEAVPHFMRGAISIANQPQLIRELRLLERRVAPSGKDRVDHGQNGTDDYANALAGMLAGLTKPALGVHVLPLTGFY